MRSDDTARILSGQILSSEDWNIWINFCADRLHYPEKTFSFYPVSSLPFKKKDIANRAIAHLLVCKTQKDIDVIVQGLNCLCYAQPLSLNKYKRVVKEILHWVKIGAEVGLSKAAIESIFGLLIYFDPNGNYHDVNIHFQKYFPKTKNES